MNEMKMKSYSIDHLKALFANKKMLYEYLTKVKGLYLPSLFGSKCVTEEYLGSILQLSVFTISVNQVHPAEACRNVTKERLYEILSEKVGKDLGFDEQRIPEKPWMINVLKAIDPENSIFKPPVSDITISLPEDMLKDVPLPLKRGKKCSLFKRSKQEQLITLLKKKQNKMEKKMKKLRFEEERIQAIKRKQEQLENEYIFLLKEFEKASSKCDDLIIEKELINDLKEITRFPEEIEIEKENDYNKSNKMNVTTELLPINGETKDVSMRIKQLNMLTELAEIIETAKESNSIISIELPSVDDKDEKEDLYVLKKLNTVAELTEVVDTAKESISVLPPKFLQVTDKGENKSHSPKPFNMISELVEIIGTVNGSNLSETTNLPQAFEEDMTKKLDMVSEFLQIVEKNKQEYGSIEIDDSNVSTESHVTRREKDNDYIEIEKIIMNTEFLKCEENLSPQ